MYKIFITIKEINGSLIELFCVLTLHLFSGFSFFFLFIQTEAIFREKYQ